MERLPNEVLLSVFENLDYMDLQRSIPLVNRHFNELLFAHRITSSELKRRLYKNSPALNELNVPRDVTFQLHPAFNEIRFSSLENEDDPSSATSGSTLEETPQTFCITYPAHPPSDPKARYKLGNRCMISVLKTLKFRGRKEISRSSVCRENAISPAISNARLKIKGLFRGSQRGIGIYGPSMVEKQPGAVTVYGLWDYIILPALLGVEKGFYSPAIREWVRGGFGAGDTSTASDSTSDSNNYDEMQFVHRFKWLGFEGVKSRNGQVNITAKLHFMGVTALNSDTTASTQEANR